MHTNDSFSPSLHPPTLPQLPIQIKQQPSGNMDDSGFFSIQVSSHTQALRVIFAPGSVEAQGVIDTSIFKVTIMM